MELALLTFMADILIARVVCIVTVSYLRLALLKNLMSYLQLALIENPSYLWLDLQVKAALFIIKSMFIFL